MKCYTNHILGCSVGDGLWFFLLLLSVLLYSCVLGVSIQAAVFYPLGVASGRCVGTLWVVVSSVLQLPLLAGAFWTGPGLPEQIIYIIENMQEVRYERMS